LNERTILEGDLSAIPLPDVLSFIATIRGNGKLVLRHEGAERTIFWHGGEIVFATSNSPEHSLGQFLLRNGKITREQYQESVRRVTPVLRAGKLLVQLGALSPKDLWWGVKHQILEIIYSVFPWKQGHFALVETTEEIQERITLSMSASSIILEGVRRLDETARIREKIPSLDIVFTRVPGAEETATRIEMEPEERRVFDLIDGRREARELMPLSRLTEFEVTQILFQLMSARMIDFAAHEKTPRPVFLDVEDSPELLRVVTTYNEMFSRLFGALDDAVGDERARDIFTTALQGADTNELWVGVFFDQRGRFDENMLIANISELPFEQRRAVLDEGLNTLLSIQLFEVSQHLDATTKVELFRYISDQKAQLERSTTGMV
jgi:hypothetical protein